MEYTRPPRSFEISIKYNHDLERLDIEPIDEDFITSKIGVTNLESVIESIVSFIMKNYPPVTVNENNKTSKTEVLIK